MTRRADEAAEKLEALTLAGVDTPPACEGDDMLIAERPDLIPHAADAACVQQVSTPGHVR